MYAEIDAELFGRTAKFCVYLHKRPDGSVFYVGKGLRSRAYDFAPSRRSMWHRNVVAKYGRENIGVVVVPCANEKEALALEMVHILIHGDGLVNLTSGGEGCAGRPMTDAQRAGLDAGRKPGKRGVPGPRPHLKLWRDSPAGKAQLVRFAEIGGAALHRERAQNCAECSCEFTTTSAKAKCCGRKCEQRYRRAGKNARPAPGGAA